MLGWAWSDKRIQSRPEGRRRLLLHRLLGPKHALANPALLQVSGILGIASCAAQWPTRRPTWECDSEAAAGGAGAGFRIGRRRQVSGICEDRPSVTSNRPSAKDPTVWQAWLTAHTGKQGVRAAVVVSAKVG